MRPVARILLEHYTILWWAIFSVSMLPACLMILGYMNRSLGINPLETLQQKSGLWAIVFLIVTLSITPLRRTMTWLSVFVHARFGKRLEDWNWIIRLRRMLGLFSFFYAALHTGIYLVLDAAFDWQWIINDLSEKPFIMLGMLAFILLIPLAITSNDTMFKYMGLDRWRRLHYLVYLIAVLVVIHFWWQMKALDVYHWPYIITMFVLLAYRLIVRYGIVFRKPRDDGMEVPERG